ncbi:MAG: hypothetical protein ACRCVA_09380 [Phreatobacter sp.]
MVIPVEAKIERRVPADRRDDGRGQRQAGGRQGAPGHHDLERRSIGIGRLASFTVLTNLQLQLICKNGYDRLIASSRENQPVAPSAPFAAYRPADACSEPPRKPIRIA